MGQLRDATRDTESDSATLDRRSRRRLEQRSRVYDTAVRLFTERGYDATTMDEIADAADVARASVFNYFPRKVAFIDEWSARRRAAASAAVGEQQDLPTLAALLERYLVVLAGLSERSRAETVACFDVAVRDSDLLFNSVLAEQIDRYLERPEARQQMRPEVDPQQVALLVATGYFAELRSWIRGDEPPFDLKEHLLSLLDLVLHGVSAR